MSFLDKIKNIVNVDEDGYYPDDDVDTGAFMGADNFEEEERAKPQRRVQRNTEDKVVNIHTTAQLQVVLVKPEYTSDNLPCAKSQIELYDLVNKLIKDKKVIVLLNKSDLNQIVKEKEFSEFPVVAVSAKQMEGMEQLYDILKEMFFQGDISYNDEVVITNIRHKNALINSYDSITKVKYSIEMDMPEDFYSIDLMNAYQMLGEIIGEAVDEDLVDTIFKEFCMGK